MNKKRKEFLESLLDVCEYWEETMGENAYKIVFSILVMFDGDSGMNDFTPVEIKGVTNGNELHEEFCALRRERNEEV